MHRSRLRLDHNVGAVENVTILADEQPIQQLLLLAAVQKALGDRLAELPEGPLWPWPVWASSRAISTLQPCSRNWQAWGNCIIAQPGGLL